MTIADQISAEPLQDILLRELHHRFYNSLQVISSMANLLGREEQHCPSVRRMTLGRLQDRIALLAGIHRLLAEPVAPGQSLGPNCRQLCDSLIKAFDRQDVSVVLRIGTFAVGSVIGRGILLLVVELVTNALKHSSERSPVFIHLSLRSGSRGYQLVVRSNTAKTTTAVQPAPRVASQLVESLGGTLSVCTKTQFEVRVSLPPS